MVSCHGGIFLWNSFFKRILLGFEEVCFFSKSLISKRLFLVILLMKCEGSMVTCGIQLARPNIQTVTAVTGTDRTPNRNRHHCWLFKLAHHWLIDQITHTHTQIQNKFYMKHQTSNLDFPKWSIRFGKCGQCLSAYRMAIWDTLVCSVSVEPIWACVTVFFSGLSICHAP